MLRACADYLPGQSVMWGCADNLPGKSVMLRVCADYLPGQAIPGEGDEAGPHLPGCCLHHG